MDPSPPFPTRTLHDHVCETPTATNSASYDSLTGHWKHDEPFTEAKAASCSPRFPRGQASTRDDISLSPDRCASKTYVVGDSPAEHRNLSQDDPVPFERFTDGTTDRNETGYIPTQTHNPPGSEELESVATDCDIVNRVEGDGGYSEGAVIESQADDESRDDDTAPASIVDKITVPGGLHNIMGRAGQPGVCFVKNREGSITTVSIPRVAYAPVLEIEDPCGVAIALSPDKQAGGRRSDDMESLKSILTACNDGASKHPVEFHTWNVSTERDVFRGIDALSHRTSEIENRRETVGKIKIVLESPAVEEEGKVVYETRREERECSEGASNEKFTVAQGQGKHAPEKYDSAFIVDILNQVTKTLEGYGMLVIKKDVKLDSDGTSTINIELETSRPTRGESIADVTLRSPIREEGRVTAETLDVHNQYVHNRDVQSQEALCEGLPKQENLVQMTGTDVTRGILKPAPQLCSRDLKNHKNFVKIALPVGTFRGLSFASSWPSRRAVDETDRLWEQYKRQYCLMLEMMAVNARPLNSVGLDFLKKEIHNYMEVPLLEEEYTSILSSIAHLFRKFFCGK